VGTDLSDEKCGRARMRAALGVRSMAHPRTVA
jgi:hypothetical protein